MNHAVIFLKPIADTPKANKFVVKFLKDHKIKIIEKSKKTSKDLEELIDDHYSQISKYARRVHPSEIKLTSYEKEVFDEAFQITWDEAVATNRIHNAKAPKEMQHSLSEAWDHPNTKKAKIKDGLKVARITMEGAEDFFLINGFYDAMRSFYLVKDATVTAYIVQFHESNLSWEKFRNNLIGSTNPEKAIETSLRGIFLRNFKSLGFSQKPDFSMNGIHASAGPIEGLVERMIWFGKKIATDPFAQMLLKNEVTSQTIDYLIQNPRLKHFHETNSVFFFTENLDESAVLKFAQDIQVSSSI